MPRYIPTGYVSHFCEGLESRVLYSAFEFHSIPDFYDLVAPVREMAAPENSEVEGFGAAVLGLGDLDNDGTMDYAVAAPGSGPDGPAGAVFIYSGQTGNLIRTLADGAADFGVSIANMGDMNSDGLPDLLIGSPLADVDANPDTDPVGAAYVYSGADGSLLSTFNGTDAGGEFGRVVAAGLDLHADDFNEIIVGAPASGDQDQGEVLIFSGIDGTLVRTLTGTTFAGRFGAAISARPVTSPIGFENGYVAVGSPDAGNIRTGEVHVFDIDGNVLYMQHGEAAGDQFGAAVLIVPINEQHTLLVGSPGASEFRGRVDQFAFFDGEFFNEFVLGDTPNARFGTVIADVGDLDTDGGHDVIAAAPGTGLVRFLYTTGNHIGGAFEQPNGGVNRPGPVILTGGIANVGDINGDGFSDVATGDGAGRVTVTSSLVLSRFPVSLSGATPDLRFAWGSGFLIADGVIRSFDQIPGLPQSSDPQTQTVIDTVLDDGAIVFHTETIPGPQISQLFVLRDGVVTPLADLVTSVEGADAGPNFDTLRFVRASTGGHLLLTGSAGLSLPQAWLFEDGVLTLLFDGTGIDVNALGDVLGVRNDEGPSDPFVVRYATGTVAVIEGLEHAGAINDHGVVVGVMPGTSSQGNPGHLGTWDDGLVTDLGPGPNVPAEFQTTRWVILDFDNDGRILASVTKGDSIEPVQYLPFLIEPGEAPVPLISVVYGRPDEAWFDEYSFNAPLFMLATEGRFVAFEAVMTPLDEQAVRVMREDSPTSTLVSDGQYSAFINQFNDVVLLSNRGTGWTTTLLASDIAPGTNIDLALFADPLASNRPFVALTGDGAVRVFSADREVGVLNLSDETAIVRGMTAFTNAEGIVHIAGITAAGDVVIYFRVNNAEDTASTFAWNYDNLSVTHLQEQGAATRSFVGHLSAFATPWHGMNITALDSDGHAQTIWWAPGRVLWALTDLTEAAQAGPLHGEIAAFATPWGTLHVNATDANGDVTSLWWAPEFEGAWRVDHLAAGGTQLDPDSVVAYVTPWGGLNIAGRDTEADRVVVYWWAPATNAWNVDVLAFRDDAESPELRGRVAASVSGAGEIGLAAAGTNENPYRFSWNIGDENLWTLENLTQQ